MRVILVRFHNAPKYDFPNKTYKSVAMQAFFARNQFLGPDIIKRKLKKKDFLSFFFIEFIVDKFLRLIKIYEDF